MKKKYYAVKKGISTGVFDDWESCRLQVSGYSGAQYKGFSSKKEALSYLNEGKTDQDKSFSEPLSDGEAIAYVDGSYDAISGDFSYGMVIFTHNGKETFGKRFTDADLAAMHNVAGEIKGAEAAMRYAAENGIKKLVIFYDYEGIQKWCDRTWQANKEGTRAYRAFYDSVCKQVDISFVKVKGHSGEKYNDLADRLAKEALGLEKMKV